VSRIRPAQTVKLSTDVDKRFPVRRGADAGRIVAISDKNEVRLSVTDALGLDR
jgi:hypothetical protein